RNDDMATKKQSGSKNMAEEQKRRPTKSVPPKGESGDKPVARRQSASSVSVRPSARRAVIVGGVRTPFVRAFAEFMELDTIALATEATRSLLERFDVPRNE